MRVEFTFELCKSPTTQKQKWFWRCRAENGKIRCHSEMYSTKGGCYNAIKSFFKQMKPGIARIDESWCENPKRRNKRKAYKRS